MIQLRWCIDLAERLKKSVVNRGQAERLIVRLSGYCRYPSEARKRL